MRAVSVLICVIVVSCFAVTSARACVCSVSSPCSSFEQAAVVFVGTVRSIDVTNGTVQRFGKTEEVLRDLVAHFEVERRFKGIPEGQGTIDVGSFVFTDCGYRFESGKRYIVYATYVGQDDLRDFRGGSLKYNLSTQVCSRTQQLPEGQNDIDLIEAMISDRPESRIFGRVVLVETELGKGPTSSKHKNVGAGMKIEARSESNAFEAITDENGNFQISAVPPGRYKVRPTLASTQSGYLGLDLAQIVEIRPPQLCGSEAIILIQSNGVIRGHVFDTEGKTAPRNIEVSLVIADSASKGLLSLVGDSTWTKDGGRYEFNGLRPGDYIVGSGLLQPPNWRSPYSGVYYPSASHQSEPKILHINEGARLDNIDIHLPEPISSFQIHGTVIDSFGKPAAGAQIEIIDVDYGKVVDKPEKLFKTGADGTFSVTGLKNRRYQVRAFLAENYLAGTGIQSEPVGITTTEPLKPVVLTLTKPGINRQQK
jgi:hypothetical protein